MIVRKIISIILISLFFDFLFPKITEALTGPEVTELISSDIIKITEFYANPPSGEYEWIELYNPQDTELDLSGWYIDDVDGGAAGSPYVILDVTIPPRSYISLDFTKNVLNNSGDEVRVLDSQKLVVASLSYENVKTDYSISLIDGVWKFSEPTKGLVNPIEPEMSDEEDENTEEEIEEEINYPEDVRITEFMACPEKGEGEWIEVYNDTGDALDLTGWKIDDVEDGGSSPLVLDEDKIGKDPLVDADAYFVISLSSSRFNNVGGDKVRLLNPTGDLVDEVSYELCQTGYSYALDNGEFKFTKTPTPEEENEIVEEEILEEEEESESEGEETENLSLASDGGRVLSANTVAGVEIPKTFEIREGVSEDYSVSNEDVIVEDTVVPESVIPGSMNKLFFLIPLVFIGIMIYVFKAKIYGFYMHFKKQDS